MTAQPPDPTAPHPQSRSEAGPVPGPAPSRADEAAEVQEQERAQQPTPHQPYDQQVPPDYGAPGRADFTAPGPTRQDPYGAGAATASGPSWGPRMGQPQAAGVPSSRSDEDLWAVLAHLSIPFLGFLGPLALHLANRDRSAWWREDVLEALNFSLLYTAAQVLGALLVAVMIGLVLLPVVFIGALVLGILGALAAGRHEVFRYPVNWRLVT